MKHPSREDWIAYLYNELSADKRTDHAAHLDGCPECSAKVSEWRASQQQLNAWKLGELSATFAARPARGPFTGPLIRWAAAAAVLLVGLGVGIGRLSAPSSMSLEQVRAGIEPELRRQIARGLRAELDKAVDAALLESAEQTEALVSDCSRVLESKRQEENRAIYAALGKLESQHVADYLSLKKDVDTVAVLTDAGLQRTTEQLVQLADYRQPDHSTDSPSN